ncbi:MAG TPA: hypothetical protein DEO43_03920 [Halieaceae bacterium]|nr:hypothetical protein [Halieaceae bacterium]
MTAWHTLLFYSVVIALGSYVGGLLPRLITMTHTRTQMAMSTVSGLMLGVAFYHLLPHSLGEFGPQYSIDDVVWWLMIGLVSMLLLLRLFHFHQHDFSVAADHAHCDHHDHLHAPQQTSQHVSHFSWAGIALGLSVHTIVDGIALAAVVLAAQTSATHAAWVGLGVFIAIFLHKPLDAISIATLTRAAGLSRQKQHLINMGFALMCPLGAVLFYLGFTTFDGLSSAWLGGTLAFAAGAFICIALSDLMPEVHFHSHDKLKLSLAFVVGIVIAYSITFIEPAGLH